MLIEYNNNDIRVFFGAKIADYTGKNRRNPGEKCRKTQGHQLLNESG